MHDRDDLIDYFRRYPLENPASYVGTRYDPAAAAAWRAEQAARRAAPGRDDTARPAGVFPPVWQGAHRLGRVGRLPPAAGRWSDDFHGHPAR